MQSPPPSALEAESSHGEAWETIGDFDAEVAAAAAAAVDLAEDVIASETRLRIDLARIVPELDLRREAKPGSEELTDSDELIRLARAARNAAPDEEPPGLVALQAVLAKRGDLAGLPFQRKESCRLDQKDAHAMTWVSLELTRFRSESMFLSRSVVGISRADRDEAERPSPYPTTRSTDASYEGNVADSLIAGRRKSLGDRYESAADFFASKHEFSVRALIQVLPAESVPDRKWLVDYLDGVDTRRAAESLAQLAIFDLNEEVRRAAVRALEPQPRSHVRPQFVKALRYPWPPVARHAAEALAALNDQGAVGPLIRLLDKPDPAAAHRTGDGDWVIDELVCVNHLRNCLLCHAPATSARGRVLGFIPTPGQPIPLDYYHARNHDNFVRADVTFLRQDFSVTHPVNDSGPWPDRQRYDYFVRTRRATAAEILARPERLATSYPQREAVLDALRRITGENAGPHREDWRGKIPLEGKPPEP